MMSTSYLVLTFPTMKVETIGGSFLTQNFDATLGTKIETEGYIFKVNKIDGHHIQYIEVKRG